MSNPQPNASHPRILSLAIPLAVNLAIALLCYAVMGSFFGWTSIDSSTLPPVIGRGLPFLQFVAAAYLADRSFVLAADRFHTSGLFKRGIPRLATQLISVALYFTFFAISISSVWGESISTLLAASGIVGLAVGFAVRGLLADIFCGIALHLDASLAVGDWICVNIRGKDIIGRVVDIQWRTTVLQFVHNQINIPNSEFASGTITNWSRPNPASEFTATIPVPVEIDRKRVLAIIDTAMAKLIATGKILDRPGHYVWISSIKESMAAYTVSFYINAETTIPVMAQSAVLGQVMDFLKAAGIQMQHVTVNAYQRRLSAADDRNTEFQARLRILAEVPLLAVLDRGELTELTRQSSLSVVAAGETVLRAGDEGDSMLVITEGRLDVRLENPNGFKSVATLWPGDCAGEMSLLTGSPRGATVVAVESTTLVEINKQAFAPILQGNPSLVERIALTIEHRKAANEQADKSTVEIADSQTQTASMVSKIRNFFKI